MNWQDMKKPIIGLSPMDGVTDASFRFITKKYGNPDVIYTEFVSTEGLCHSATKLLDELEFDLIERPIIAQIFGNTPPSFRQASLLLCELGFDGIDINMGCPANTVAQRGGGAALIGTPKLAQDLIRAVYDGINDWKNGMKLEDTSFSEQFMQKAHEQRKSLSKPYLDRSRHVSVSVKTRVGIDRPVISEWIPALLEMKPEVITIHGRTLNQQYGGVADWKLISDAKDLAKNTNTMIFGNGDIKNRDEAIDRITRFHLDGALIGQASFGNPWAFLKSSQQNISWETKMDVALEHARYYEMLNGNTFFLPMRKHLGWYMSKHPKASEFRQKMYQLNSSEELRDLIPDILSTS